LKERMNIICTVVSENYSVKALELCDTIELRLDVLPESVVGRFIEWEKDLIFTCRREGDGGGFRGEEERRLSIISRYVMYADFVDIEYDVDEDFFRSVKRSGVGIIESYHSLKNPGYTYLRDIIEGKKGDILKIAIPGKHKKDIKLILKLHSEYDNLIAFLIGEEYRFTRIISSLSGSPFIYCHAGTPTAPGQFSVEEIYRLRNILTQRVIQ